MLTMVACDTIIMEQLKKKAGRYTDELTDRVLKEQANACSGVEQRSANPSADVCSAAKAAVSGIGIDFQNKLLSTVNGGLKVLVGGQPVVLLHAGLWGLLLLTAVTVFESLAWLIALRLHAGGIAKGIIIVTLTFSWATSLVLCAAGVGVIGLLYTLFKTVFYRYNWDRIEYCSGVLGTSLGSLKAFPGMMAVAFCSLLLQVGECPQTSELLCLSIYTFIISSMSIYYFMSITNSDLIAFHRSHHHLGLAIINLGSR
jgi:hypothetical protein